MIKNINLENLIPLIKESLANQQIVSFKPNGISMYPTLVENKDVVYLDNIKQLKKYDLILFSFNNKYYLHRLIKINKDNTYNFCGDNNVSIEKNVLKENLIAKVVKYEHNNIIVDCSKKSFYFKGFFITRLRIFKKIVRRLKRK